MRAVYRPLVRRSLAILCRTSPSPLLLRCNARPIATTPQQAGHSAAASSSSSSAARWLALFAGFGLSCYTADRVLFAADSSSSSSLLPRPIPAQKGRTLFSFGSNPHGALGLGDDASSRPLPTALQSFTDSSLVQLVAGNTVAGALTETGEVWMWGRGGSGALGHGDNSSPSRPKRVEALVGKRVTHLSLSDTHSAAVETLPNGLTRVWVMGDRGLGMPPPHPAATPARGWRASVENPQRGKSSDSFQSNEPVLLESLSDKNIIATACGKHHSLALTREGRVLSFGQDRFGALGLGESTLRSDAPTFVGGPLENEKIVSVAAGNGISFFLSERGQLFVAGSNEYGGGGLNSQSRRIPSPTLVRGLPPISQVDAQAYHVAAIDDGGRVWTWGWNLGGQLLLGHRNLENRSPQLVHFPSATDQLPTSSSASTAIASSSAASSAASAAPVIAVQARTGFETTAIVSQDGRLLIGGRGREGQLGRGDRMAESVAALRDRPIEVTYFSSNKLHVVQAATGGDFTLALVKEAVPQ